MQGKLDDKKVISLEETEVYSKNMNKTSYQTEEISFVEGVSIRDIKVVAKLVQKNYLDLVEQNYLLENELTKIDSKAIISDHN